MLTIQQAALATGLSTKALRRRVERGTLASVLSGDRRRIPMSELMRAGLLLTEQEARVSLASVSGEGPRGTPAGNRGAAGDTANLALVEDLLERLEGQATELGALRERLEQAQQSLVMELDARLQVEGELAAARERILELEGVRRGWAPD